LGTGGRRFESARPDKDERSTELLSRKACQACDSISTVSVLDADERRDAGNGKAPGPAIARFAAIDLGGRGLALSTEGGTAMRKKLALLTAAALVASVVVAGFVMSTSATAATTLTVIEHAEKQHFTDVGKTGLSPGDSFTFHNPIYDSTDTTQVGTNQGSCLRITKLLSHNRGSWECVWTTFLESGASSITVESPYYDTGLGTGAITGGTGTYVGAGGSLDFDCSRTECTDTFNLS
jgi:hypothetical protein